MITDLQLTLGIFVLAMVAFVTELAAIEVIAGSVMVLLMLTGVLSVDDAVHGFADSAPITIAAMFVISSGIMRTGGVSFVARRLMILAHGDHRRMVLYCTVTVAAISGFMNNTPVVAIFVPLMLSVCRETKIAPSRVLLPISYASILGGMMTLIGTSTNLLVRSTTIELNEARAASGLPLLPELQMFDFLPLGLIVSGIGVLYLYTIGSRLLPDRQGVNTSAGIREYMTEVSIPGSSKLLGKRLDEVFKDSKLRLLQLIRGERIHWPPFTEERLQPQDTLLIKGPPPSIIALLQGPGIELSPELKDEPTVLLKTVDSTLGEVVLTPGSRAIGRTIADIGFRRHHQVSVVAIQRRGSHIRQEIAELPLQLGDTLLVHGSREAIDLLRNEDDYLLAEGIDEEVVYHKRAPIPLITIALVVLLASLKVAELTALAMAGAGLMILTKCLTVRQAWRAIDWSVIMLIAGMLALGKAMWVTGAAELMADYATTGVNSLGLPTSAVPWATIAVIYLVTVALSETISHAATALVMTPIACSIADGLEVAAMPFIVTVAFAASLSFCTPIGYQTNTFVYGPGNYRFSDYFRVGLPLSLICWVTCTALIPYLFPF